MMNPTRLKAKKELLIKVMTSAIALLSLSKVNRLKILYTQCKYDTVISVV